MARPSAWSRWSISPSTSPRVTSRPTTTLQDAPGWSTSFPDIPERVYTVGRLDEDSTGLMILTNDGELANRLAHPRFGVEKLYRALVAGLPGPEMLPADRGRLALRRQGPGQAGADRRPPGPGHDPGAGAGRGQEPRDPPDARQARAQGHVADPGRGRPDHAQRAPGRRMPPADATRGRPAPQGRRRAISLSVPGFAADEPSRSHRGPARGRQGDQPAARGRHGDRRPEREGRTRTGSRAWTRPWTRARGRVTGLEARRRRRPAAARGPSSSPPCG